MRNLIKIVIVLSVFTQISNAQSIEEYKAVYDSVVPNLIEAEKGQDAFIKKTFFEFVEYLNCKGNKIDYYGLIYNSRLLYPQEIDGIVLYFVSIEDQRLAVKRENSFKIPSIMIKFKDKKVPYKEAIDNLAGTFDEKVLKQFSNSIIESIDFGGLDGMYRKKNK
jgi:hypothetical protein